MVPEYPFSSTITGRNSVDGLRTGGNNICNTVCVVTFDRIVPELNVSLLEAFLVTNIVPAMFIVVFSEVIPQVIFTKYALYMGSRCRHLMVFFIVLTFPASYPLSKFLDLTVGKEMRMTMDNRILGGIIRQQKYGNANMADVVENAMNLQVRRVRDVMTPLEKIIGVLNVKDLLLIDDSLDIRVGMVMQLWHRSTMFRFVSSETPVAQLMLELKKGFPLAIVVDFHHTEMCYTVIGIVTLEDNLEEVIGEIYDEKDVKIKARVEEGVTIETVDGVKSDLLAKPSKRNMKKKTVSEEGKTDEYAPLLPHNNPSGLKK
ncbi:hypothetical protein DICVIV_03546 [Dictyocaulus viviparus]|uniref:CNNM transmembrane domain-containing protein n=1 Tax=Dictyocaulus viviparus TaxID=29172 RepID=A0A0D8Y082_DICVI|nr:hypothetical protein DICVIV_03546 [Dictyocaulus viviparus]